MNTLTMLAGRGVFAARARLALLGRVVVRIGALVGLQLLLRAFLHLRLRLGHDAVCLLRPRLAHLMNKPVRGFR